MGIEELKHKLRQLKKLEEQIRFKNFNLRKYKKFVWDEYFSTKDENDRFVKHNMKTLLGMNHEKLKEVFTEFFYGVYFEYYKENGIIHDGFYDPELLSILGLPSNASTEDIKSKFRELAKRYHPDLGGESNKFIELVATYKKLMGEE